MLPDPPEETCETGRDFLRVFAALREEGVESWLFRMDVPKSEPGWYGVFPDNAFRIREGDTFRRRKLYVAYMYDPGTIKHGCLIDIESPTRHRLSIALLYDEQLAEVSEAHSIKTVGKLGRAGGVWRQVERELLPNLRLRAFDRQVIQWLTEQVEVPLSPEQFAQRHAAKILN